MECILPRIGLDEHGQDLSVEAELEGNRRYPIGTCFPCKSNGLAFQTTTPTDEVAKSTRGEA